MNKQDLTNILRNIGANLARNARKMGSRSPQASSAQPRPASPRDMLEVGRRAAVYLCVLLSCIAVLFASCAKAPAGGDAPPDSSAPVSAPADPSPAADPENSVTPAL